MARTVWTKEEKAQIFARMEVYFRDRPNATRRDALRDAQSVLDSSRWIVVTDQRVYNYRDRIEIARQNARKSKPEKAVETPAPIPAPTPAPERKESTTERLAQAFERLLDIMADAVANKVAAKMVDLPAQRFQPGVSLTEHRPKHDPRPIPHPTGQPRPGVLVIGLLPAQAHHVSHLLGDKLDLSFFTAEEAVTCPKLTRAHTVLMTKFINHSVQDKYRKVPRLHFCNGGVAELMKVLDTIVAPVL
jgi:hypothetical protein